MFDPVSSHDLSNPCAGQNGPHPLVASIPLVIRRRAQAHVITSPGDAAGAGDQGPRGSAGHSCLKYRATGQRS